MTPSHEVFTSSLVFTELAAGMQRQAQNTAPHKMAQNFMKVATIEPYGRDAAQLAGELLVLLSKKGHAIGPMDTMIAAHALAMGATLVTANTKHFVRIPELRLANWSRQDSKR